MNQHELALQWAIQYLTDIQNVCVFSHRLITQTAYSIVYRIDTSNGLVYLKQTPEALFLEPKTLTFLRQYHGTNIPRLLAENNALHCFLMTACGDDSLRTVFKGQVDLTQILPGISHYTKMQRALENHINPLVSLGIPDWRLDKFASLYYQLIMQDTLLRDDGLTANEIERLHQLYPNCIKLCKTLSEYKIPATLSNLC